MITIDQARTLYEAAGDSTHDFDHVLRVLEQRCLTLLTRTYKQRGQLLVLERVDQ